MFIYFSSSFSDSFYYYLISSRNCPARFVWLKVVSFDRSFLKGKAPRLSADFNHPLSYKRPFKFPYHLVGPLGIDNILAILAINIHSAIFKLKQHGNGHENRKGSGNGNGHGHGNGN
jgi:hypothetical protein